MKITKFTNQFIKKVSDNLNSFSYNVIIANLHEMYSFLNKEIVNGYSKKSIIQNYSKILICMLPVIPHFSSECLSMMKLEKETQWPSYDNKLLEENKINFVVQINGKKRKLIETDRDIKEGSLLNIIKQDDFLSKYLKDKNIIKVIFIKNRLINILLK